MSEKNEVPLFTLRCKRGMLLLGGFILIMVMLYGTFGAVLPVLMTGDYNSMWLHDEKRTGRNMIAFYLFLFVLISSPFFVGVFKAGSHYDFYDNRLEVKPFFRQRKLIIPYEQMHVLVYGNYRVVITRRSAPSWMHPIQRYRIQYLEGLAITLLPHGYENPDDLPKALQIIKEKAAVLSEKKSIYF